MTRVAALREAFAAAQAEAKQVRAENRELRARLAECERERDEAVRLPGVQ